MTDKPNYSLKDLLNELKEKEEEFENCEIVIQDNNKSKDIFEEVLNIKLESKEYLELDVEQQCSLIMSKKAEISALKKGIQACEERDKEVLDKIDKFVEYEYNTFGFVGYKKLREFLDELIKQSINQSPTNSSEDKDGK